MVETNKALVRRWFKEVWNEGREATIDELFSEKGVGHGLGHGEAQVNGPPEFRHFVRNIRGSLGDLHISIEDIMGEDDKVMVRLRMEGTHTGDGLGVAPTGVRVRLAGLVLLRIENGQIIEGWNSWDQLGLLTQIGALPPAGEDRFLAAR